MTPDEHDVAYTEGRRATLRAMLSDILRQLGYEGADQRPVRLIEEREAAVSQLRTLCAEFGDNNWTEHMHLADVIEKHLGKHLHALELDEPDVQFVEPKDCYNCGGLRNERLVLCERCSSLYAFNDTGGMIKRRD